MYTYSHDLEREQISDLVVLVASEEENKLTSRCNKSVRLELHSSPRGQSV